MDFPTYVPGAYTSPLGDSNLLAHFDLLDMSLAFADNIQALPAVNGGVLGSLKPRAGSSAVIMGNSSGSTFRPTVNLSSSYLNGGPAIVWSAANSLVIPTQPVAGCVILSGYHVTVGANGIADFLLDGVVDRTCAFTRSTLPNTTLFLSGTAGSTLIDFKEAAAVATPFVVGARFKAGGPTNGWLRTSAALDFFGSSSSGPTSSVGIRVNGRGNGATNGGGGGRGTDWHMGGLSFFTSDMSNWKMQCYMNWHWVQMIRQVL